MFCIHCGKENPSGSKYCSKCGKLVAISDIDVKKHLENSSANIEKSTAPAETKEEYKNFTVSKDTKLTGVAGWLALFIVGIFLSSLLNIIGTFVDFTTWGLIDLAIGIYGVYVGYLLSKVKPNAVKNAKIYLIINAVLGLLLIILVYSTVDPTDDLFSVAWRTFIYGVIWFWYFSASKRVKNTYQQ